MSQLEGISAKYLVVVVLVTAATVLLLVYFALQKWLRRCLQMTPVPTINEEEDQKGEDELDVSPSSARKSMVMYVPESESNQSPQ